MKDAETQVGDSKEVVVEKLQHFSDRSLRHLLQSETNVIALLEMIIPELAALMDFQGLVPAERSLLSETLREREADILYNVPFRTKNGTQEVLIYILIEHQSTTDDIMAFRLLNYMNLLWDRHRRDWDLRKTHKTERKFPPILPIVFYTGEGTWKIPLDFRDIIDLPEELERFIPRFDILFFDLKHTETEELRKNDTPLGWLLTVLQKERAEKADMNEALIEAISHLRKLQETQPAQWREAIGYLLQIILHRRTPEEHRDLIQLVEQHSHDKEVNTMAQSMAEVLLEQGIQQGIQQGARQAMIENIIAVLEVRFPDADINTLRPRLKAIVDLDYLKQLNLDASLATSFRTFQEHLET